MTPCACSLPSISTTTFASASPSFAIKCARSRSDVRWVGPETFHVTLQFLGETKKLDEIRHALAAVEIACRADAFRGAGFFPNSKAPRVFWVGIEGDENLQALGR